MNYVQRVPERDYETVEEMISAAETFLADGKLEKSETLCRQVLESDRANADALAVLGLLAHQTGQTDQARRLVQKATELAPHKAVHHFRLANILHDLEDLEGAVDGYHRALECDPHFYGVLVNLGNTLLAQEKYEDAIEVSLRAIGRVPQSAEAHSNLGQSYFKVGRIADAHRALTKSVEYAPHRSDLRNNLGVLQQLIGDVDGAIMTFQSVSDNDPQALLAERNLKIAVLNSPQWNADALFKLHQTLGKRHLKYRARHKKFPSHDFTPDRKLRVAYVSSDFHDHPVGNNLLPLIRNHDKSQVETYLYANVETPDQRTKTFREVSDHWRETGNLTEKQLSQQMAEDRIDIAVYLAGRFNLNRVETATHRPAPVQVSFHDCATSGLEAMDYWLTDMDLHPEDTSEQFTEELYRLPLFYQFSTPDHVPHVSEAPCDYNGYVTFGSFNKPEKLSDEVVSTWAEILKQCENSKLLLKYRNLFADKELKKIWHRRFEQHGIEADRVLLLADDCDQADHLALYSQIDIALDPFPFNGATTTYEALMMGVPVISLEGERFVDRVSATLLKQAGLPEFVTESKDEYVSNAIKLAASPSRLAKWRKVIRPRVLGSPLFDGGAYARSVEHAFRDMWCQRCHAHTN